MNNYKYFCKTCGTQENTQTFHGDKKPCYGCTGKMKLQNFSIGDTGGFKEPIKFNKNAL